MTEKFDTLMEGELSRFQTGGLLVGDRVQFKKNCLNHEYIKARGDSYKQIVAACMEPGFDLNLRIGAIKSIYPTTSQNYTGGTTDAPDGIFLDIYIEYAPGLYRNPMTVPLDVIERLDDGVNRGPIPDSLKRPNNVHGPQEVAKQQLAQSNTVLPNSNSWDDAAPGGRNF